MIIERFDGSDRQFDELTKKMRVANQRFAGLEHEARQQRLITDADVESDTKTRKRTEDASAENRVMNGDISSTRRVKDSPTTLASFGMIVEPPASKKCIKDVMANEGAEKPRLHLPPVKVRIVSAAAGGLLPADKASTAMRTTFSRPFPSWTLGEETKKKNSRTNLNQLAPSCWREVSKTKSRTLVYDPDGCSSRLRGCPFLGW